MDGGRPLCTLKQYDTMTSRSTSFDTGHKFCKVFLRNLYHNLFVAANIYQIFKSTMHKVLDQCRLWTMGYGNIRRCLHLVLCLP